MNAKQREFWREQFTDSIIMASGAAVILGRQDIAQALNRTLSDIDRPAETCYTKANQRETAQKTEDNIMANKIKVWAFTANGIGWDRAITLYFDSREHAEAAYAHYTYKDPIYYAGAFASDKFEPAYPIDYGATVHDGQLYPTDKC